MVVKTVSKRTVSVEKLKRREGEESILSFGLQQVNRLAMLARRAIKKRCLHEVLDLFIGCLDNLQI